MDVNKVILVCTVTSDPVTRNIENGDPVTNFKVVTSRNNANGLSVTSIGVSFWGESNHISVAPYLYKGQRLYIEGQLRENNFNNKDGLTINSYNVSTGHIVMLSTRRAKASEQ